MACRYLDMRRVLLLVILVFGLALAACSSSTESGLTTLGGEASADVGPDEEADTTDESIEVSTDPEVSVPQEETTETDTNPDAGDLEAYHWVYRFDRQAEGESYSAEFWGAFDPAAGRSWTMMNVRDVWPLVSEFEPETDDVIETVHQDGVTYSRGLIPALGYDDSIDPNAWYIDDALGEGQVDLLLDTQSFAGLRARVAAVADVTDAESTSGLAAFDVELDLSQVDDLDGTVFQEFAALALVNVRVESDSDGRVGRVTISDNGDDEGGRNHVEIEFADFGEGVTMPEVTDPQPLPLEPTAGEIVEELAEVAQAQSNPSDEVIFRFWTYLGYQLDDPAAPREFDISLTPDGTLVRVDGTSIFDGAESFTTWQLSPEGVRRLTDFVQTNRLVAAGERLGSNDLAYALDMSDVYFDAHPHDGAISAKDQAALHALADRLFDPSWLGADITSGPEPWIPDQVTMYAEPSNGDVGPPYEWPVTTPILELAVPLEDLGEGTTVMCLTGDDAAAAWTLVREGENHAYIPVIDDGELWSLTYRISYPGYQLFSDPC